MTEEEQIKYDQEFAARLVNGEEWKWAKAKLEKIFDDYWSLATLPEYKTASALQSEIQTRKKAIGLVKTWIEEVEGAENQHKFIKSTNEAESLLTRF